MKKPYNKQIDEEKHKMLKVELVNGKKIELHNPYIQEDKLIGVIITENKKRFQIQKDTLSISFFDINQIKVKKIDTGKTIEGVFFYKCRDSNNIFSHVVFTYQSVVSRYNISAVN